MGSQVAKIKYTKNELKAQRDALSRFSRYLPTLQLKKQQLQMEVRAVEAAISEKESEETKARAELDAWVELFSEKVDLESYVGAAEVDRTTGNIAGVAIPLFGGIRFDGEDPDPFGTPAWLDDATAMVQGLARLCAERKVLEEQRRLLNAELRTTSQRVNLFEKVKIPECRENIRVIRIFMGDQQTAAVARAKIAKGKSVEKVRSG